jgi:hypothetical protein
MPSPRRSTISLPVPGLPSERVLVPVACGLLATVLAAIAMIPSLRPSGWSLTVLPRVDANTGMGQAAKAIDPGFRLVNPGAYDGEFYWGVAVDPIARGAVHAAFDKPSYRYGHPLYGWLGWLASAGQARLAAGALALVGLAAIFAAGAAAASLGVWRGRSGGEGLFVALNPGLLYAAAHDLAEPLTAALLLVALNGYVRDRRLMTLVCLALLPLAKEELVVVALLLAAWDLVRRRRLAEVAPLVATILPALVWWTYARLTLGAWFTSGDTALGFPLAGWSRALIDAGIHSFDSDAALNQLGEVTVVVLVALLGLLAVAGLRSLLVRGPVELVYLALAVVAALLAPNATVLLRDAMRNTALLIVLVPFVIASPSLAPTWTERHGGRSWRAPARSPT